MSFSEGRILRVDEVAAMLDSTAAILEESKRVNDNLSISLRKVENYFNIEKSAFVNAADSDEVYSKIPFIEEELIGFVRVASSRLYAMGRVYPDALSKETRDLATESCYQKILSPEDQVLAFLEPNAIYVRTPMLWNNQSKRVRGRNGRTIGADRSKNYCDLVTYAIRLASNFFAYDFTKYEKKTLHYLFLYADLPVNKVFIVDNDNHLTKYVTDAIAGFLPNGDHPLFCNMYFSAVQSKIIPEGTYITVTPTESGCISEDEIIKFWEQKYKEND